jgi:hypothetical protein
MADMEWIWREVSVRGLDDRELLSERGRALFRRAVGFEIEFYVRCGSSALRFIDRHGRQVADFPWWDDVERDLRTWTSSDVPLGDVARPNEDLDQCWRILIWQHADRVYIAESDGDMNFHSLYWVPAEDYISAWTGALASARGRS